MLYFKFGVNQAKAIIMLRAISTHTPGRKIVMFRNTKTAISPQPLNEILRNKD